MRQYLTTIRLPKHINSKETEKLKKYHPDLLVGLLPITALFHECHDDVLRRHERELLTYASRDNTRVYNEPLRHVLQRRKYDIRREERLGQRHTSVRTVVQRAFEPLHRCRPKRVLVQRHEVPCDRADALRAHRISFVCHSR